MKLAAQSIPSVSGWLGILLAMFMGVKIEQTAIAQAADKGQTFRVMSYNIHHGEGLDGRVDLERIAEVIRREKADIVALQEVDRGVLRTSRRDIVAELAALTGMTGVFSNNFHYQGGEYGNAILSKFPVLQWTNTHLKMLRPGEQRGLLRAEIKVGERKVLFLNTHIDYRPDDAERIQNVSEFRDILQAHDPMPVIVCGDFNDTPGSRTHLKMKEHFVDAWEAAGSGDGFTYPSAQPNKRIDYVWITKNSALAPVKAWTVSSPASDHLPLAVEFRLD